jgi:hypothetical protein
MAERFADKREKRRAFLAMSGSACRRAAIFAAGGKAVAVNVFLPAGVARD